MSLWPSLGHVAGIWAQIPLPEHMFDNCEAAVPEVVVVVVAVAAAVIVGVVVVVVVSIVSVVALVVG